MPLSLAQIKVSLPDQLSDLMAGDPMATRAIDTAARLEDWFQSSTTPFFRFYTDHSAQHSAEVFKTAIELRSDGSDTAISSADICTLLMSSYLHDAGMHLTEKQFIRLIEPSNTDVYCTLDVHTWPELWRIFLREAKRFSPDQLTAIFGDSSPVSDIPADEQEFTDRHRMLIGEFLRRHHPRLAHDIALGLNAQLGLPQLFGNLDDWERDIVGLIGRSHGTSVRSLFPYVKENFDLREYRKIHIVYLMCLLRISDYAQIQASRAPILKNRIHSIRSPISQREWRVHQSIHNITRTHDDPEALVIDARPESIQDFLRVRDWLSDLQSEIDISWATLGEIYGRQTNQNLDQLGLAIRRLRSDILDRPNHKDFVLERIGFRVAEAEMLALLLAPLYGDHGGYGIRELFQNATDAVRERIAANAGIGSFIKGKIDLTLTISNGSAVFTIKDNGTGMTLDVLKNYFLNAGASFRSSGEWRATHLGDDGNATVKRSGRFGVGALAGFIIGDQMSVETKSYNSTVSPGYTFHCSISDQIIQIKKAEFDVGTKISIACFPSQIANLKTTLTEFEDIFHIDDNIEISISIHEDSTERQIDPKPYFTSEPKYAFKTSNYENVRVFSGRLSDRRKDFVNGIAVTPYGDNSSYRSITSLYELKAPFIPPKVLMRYGAYYTGDNYSFDTISLSIDDLNANAPLNLSRNYFNSYDDEITSKINQLAFSEFADFMINAGDDLFHANSYSTSLQSSILKVRRRYFRFNNRGVSPLDYNIMRHQADFPLVILPDTIGDARIYCSTIEDTDFCFRTEPTLSGSAFVEHARRHRQLSRNKTVSSSAMIVENAIAEGFSLLASCPVWLSTAVKLAPRISVNGKSYVILAFGTPDGVGQDAIGRILAVGPIDWCELIDFNGSDFLELAPKRNGEIGAFSQLWLDRFGVYLPISSTSSSTSYGQLDHS